MDMQDPYRVPPSEMAVSCRGAAATAVGTANTVVIVWPTFTDTSGAFVHTSTAAAGSSFLCRRAGIWRIDTYAALAAAADLQLGISLNAVGAGALTGPPVDFAAVDAGAGSEGVQACAGFTAAAAADQPLLHCGRTIRLIPGDVIRILTTAGVTLAANNSRLFMDLVHP